MRGLEYSANRTISRRTFVSMAAALYALPIKAQNALPPLTLPLSIAPNPTEGNAVLNFSQTLPGPLLQVRAGNQLILKLDNQCSQVLAFDVQGLTSYSAMTDTGELSGKWIEPQATSTIELDLPHPGLYFYRALSANFDLTLQCRGLYGALIVQNREPYNADHDLLAVLGEYGQSNGSLGSAPPVRLNGNEIPWTLKLFPGERVRLRLINASPWRAVALRFADMTPKIIAIDSQPCEPFEPLRHTIPVGPGARFEVVFDVPNLANAKIEVLQEKEEPASIIQIDSLGDQKLNNTEIAGLPYNTSLPTQIPLQDAVREELFISEGAAPDRFMLRHANKELHIFSNTPLFSVKSDMPVIIGISNKSKCLFAVHIAGATLRVLHDLDDGWEPYWRDSILIEPGKTHHVSFLAGQPGRWLLECLPCIQGAPSLGSWYQIIA